MVYGDTRVARSGQWQRRGRPDISGPAAPFYLGITEPNADNTGPRVAPLQTFGSQGSPYTYTITTPGVYERLRIYGRINIVESVVSGVTIRDCEVIMQASATQINGIQFNAPDAHDNTIEFTTVRVGDSGTATEEQSTCIRGRGFTAYRCNLSGAVDGFQVYTPSQGTARQRARILGNYIHDLIVSPSTQSDGWTHNDDVQGLGSIDLEIIGNGLHGGRTSCVIINTTVTAHGWGDCIIEDNWCYGHPTEGATINVSPSGATIANLSIKRNRIDRGGHDNGQITVKAAYLNPTYFGATGTVGSPATWVYGPDANVYMDDGSVNRVQNGG